MGVKVTTGWQVAASSFAAITLLAGVAVAQASGAALAPTGGTVQSLLAPLPGMAASPSLTASAVTAIALACDSSSIQGVLGNLCRAPVIARVRERASLPLLIGISIFTAICFLANTGKLQGLLGKLLKLVETVAGLAAYLVLAQATAAGAGSTTTAPVAAVSMMGTLDLAGALPLAVALAAGLAAMMLVRLAIDIVVWLSPLPFVDLLLETAERGLALAFLALMLLSPTAAAVLAVIVLVLALLAARWAARTLDFIARVVLQPLVARLFDSPPPELVDDHLAARFPQMTGPAVAAEAMALRVAGLPARARGALFSTAGGVVFTVRRRLRSALVRRLDGPGCELELVRATLWFELRVISGGEVAMRLALPASIAPIRGQLAAALGARDGEDVGGVAALKKLFQGATEGRRASMDLT
jgi:hypothetical protein